MFLLDLAVPRDIAPEVAGLDDVYLYTVDDLEQVIEGNRASRREAAQQADAIIDLQVVHYLAWWRAQGRQDALRKLRAEGRCGTRSTRWPRPAKQLAAGADPADVMQRLAHQLTNRLLHAPSAALRQAALDGDADLLRAAERLFRSDDDTRACAVSSNTWPSATRKSAACWPTPARWPTTRASARCRASTRSSSRSPPRWPSLGAGAARPGTPPRRCAPIPSCASWPTRKSRPRKRASRNWTRRMALLLVPGGSARRGQPVPGSARRHRRRRGGDLRRRPVPHVRALRRAPALAASKCVSASAGEHGGYKEIVARIEGRGAYSRLKFESGTHRVQRVPDTESQGRIHTSAATVAILPELREVDEIEINPRRPEGRHVPRLRRRRPARQQDRVGDPHHPPAQRHRGRVPGRALAAQEPRHAR